MILRNILNDIMWDFLQKKVKKLYENCSLNHIKIFLKDQKETHKKVNDSWWQLMIVFKAYY
jgi:hypothetical protein